MMQLISPSIDLLHGYIHALEQGWSPDNVHGESAIKEQLEAIAKNPIAFINGLTDINALGEPILLPDGTTTPRLPSYQLWLWDGDFCGVISLRWQAGANTLPPSCLGHIGYAVVPWKRGNGYATKALNQLLNNINVTHLKYIEIITDPDNHASKRVIENNGGMLIEQFNKPQQYGESTSLRYKITI